MALTGYYASNLNRDMTDGDITPSISHDLDSIRAYQWEITFHPPEGVEGSEGAVAKPFTLAAKQVNGIGVSVEDIPVHRVNDQVYYPGKPSTEEMTVTFDNIVKTKANVQLFRFFQSIYDPVTGEFTTTFQNNPGVFKTNIELVQLSADMQPFNYIQLIGAWPKALTAAEYNYSQNEFHTLEMKLRYDFIIHKGSTGADPE